MASSAPSRVVSWRAPSARSRWTRSCTGATGAAAARRRLPRVGVLRRPGQLGRRTGAGEGRQAIRRGGHAPRALATARPAPQQRHALELRPARRRAVRDPRRLAALAEAPATGRRSAPACGLPATPCLPKLGVYRPIWEYDLETLGKDLSAHLVFGTATAGPSGRSRPNGPCLDDGRRHRRDAEGLRASGASTGCPATRSTA